MGVTINSDSSMGVDMKSILKKIGTITVGGLALVGLSVNGNAAVNPEQRGNSAKNEIINDVTEQTPLFLYHADELIYDDGELLSWHYSHRSHSSHSSHSSHQSHQSHYSSRY